jgi:hypothetical protein
MKFSALILSFTVLILSCMPCQDDIVIKSGKSTIELAKSSQNQQDNHKKDACSPFCTCSCCYSGVNFTFSSPVIGKIEVIAEKIEVYYITSVIRSMSSPVWQPPKLSA